MLTLKKYVIRLKNKTAHPYRLKSIKKNTKHMAISRKLKANQKSQIVNRYRQSHSQKFYDIEFYFPFSFEENLFRKVSPEKYSRIMLIINKRLEILFSHNQG